MVTPLVSIVIRMQITNVVARENARVDANRRDFMTTTGIAAAAGVLGAAVPAHAVEINAMQPTPAQMQAFVALPDDGPIVMLNLLKFKPDGGQAEYLKYSALVQPMVVKQGGKVLFVGRAHFCLIGDVTWDAVALVQYPSKQAFIAMTSSAGYQAIHHHRDAGLEGQVLYALQQGAPTA